MNTHSFTARHQLAPPTSINLRLPHMSRRAVRGWLNEPARHEPTQIAGHMYGLLLRPAERPDIDRRA
jgi:hypothetical protein